jgi:cysteinyl-tRNA synthetase
MRRLFWLLLLLLAAFALGAVTWASRIEMPREALGRRTGPSLYEAANWGYQLQRVKPSTLGRELDLFVTDYSRDGTAIGAWSPADVERLRQRPGGKPRIVLAYLSIGEAESYRGYWRREWALKPPSWLGRENPEWKGNFTVRYWQTGWQGIHVDPKPTLLRRLTERFFPSFVSEPYLDLILEAGFDGVFLDKVDAFEDWADGRPTAAAEMVAFVEAIANYARSRRPGFLVVAQNGEALLRTPRFLEAIDGIAKEDLTHGVGGDGVANPPDEIASATAALGLAIAAGKTVLQVEYLDDPAARRTVAENAARSGYKLLFARRQLNVPPEAEQSEIYNYEDLQPKDLQSKGVLDGRRTP